MYQINMHQFYMYLMNNFQLWMLMGAGSDSNPDVLLIKHRRRSKRNIALFDQLTAPNKAFAQGSSFPWNFLNHRGQNSLAVHGWVWVGRGWLWPPIDPEMSGSQVAASKSRLAPPNWQYTELFPISEISPSSASHGPTFQRPRCIHCCGNATFQNCLWIPKTFDKSPLERDKCHFSHKKQFHPEESTIVSVFRAAGLFCSRPVLCRPVLF